jgi:tetratricopeptide (TPR) repeat protein
MLGATPGPATVSPAIPETDSQMSFVRLVRLQRIVESARRSLIAAFPTLPPGAAVRYWELPRFAEVAFLDRTALRVWYRDSTLVWSRFGGMASLHQPVDAMLEFTENQPMPGYALEPEAVRLYLAGWRAQNDNRWDAADSLYVLARQATRTRWALAYAICNNRARIALARDRPDQAVGFLQEYDSLKGRDASYWAVSAWIEARYGNPEAALEQVQRCLALDPGNEDGLRLAQALRGSKPAP